MITINFQNLIYFLPQYIVATIVSILTFIFLRRSSPSGKFDFLLSRNQERTLENTSEFRSRKVVTGSIEYLSFSLEFVDFTEKTSDRTIDLNGLACPVRDSFEIGKGTFADVVLQPMEEPEDEKMVYAHYSRLQKPKIYENDLMFDLYSSIFSVSIWGGIVLLLTPFSRLYFFIPHFSSSINLLIGIILGITIFESVISNVVFHVGNSRKWISTVEIVVFALVTLSLFTPSMGWVMSYNFRGLIEVYFMLLVLILLITYLIFQLSNKRSVFLLSMYSSIVAYTFFISITMYNILDLILKVH